ncbi:MAG TPA: AMP-dependent synthetase/ligase [Streptosporangiaceae bacterium]|nr:AMP-dependent synthetase/ligase [Streptosporangiaceae bacterium]
MTSAQVPAEIAAQRAALQQAWAGRTLCDALASTVERYGDLPAYSDRDGADPWRTITWAQARELALQLAAAFAELGLQPGEKVALMLPNRLEHVLADFGVLHAGGVPVTFYATLAAEQISFMAGNCDARIAVIDGASELARWQQVLSQLPSLRTVIVRDAAVCPSGAPYLSWQELADLGAERLAADPGLAASRVAAIKPDDPVTLLYTSGTTGNPKGVIITHANVLYEVETGRAADLSRMHVRWVSYLPLAHIAERMFTLYLAICNATHTYFCHDAASQLIGTMGEVKPTAFFGVPRIFEKVMAGIQGLLAGEQDADRKAAVAAAFETGLAYVRSCQYGESTPPELAASFATADEQVLRPIRSLLGLGGAEIVVSGAAPLPPEVGAFFGGLGVRIMDVYGMSETTGAFTTNTPSAFRLGTVGRPVPGIEVRIADDGEILARGPLNTPGYLNLPEQTADLIDADGWLHTGDIGSIDDDGFVRVVDRKKELIITAGGENVSPAAVENLLVAHPLIGQALAYGDRRPYLVALLTLDGGVAPAWARARGIADGSLAELAAHDLVRAEVERAVADANAKLARVQQVKYWELLPVEWTAESEELTPTFKLKRRVVHAKYADVIDALYRGGPTPA